MPGRRGTGTALVVVDASSAVPSSVPVSVHAWGIIWPCINTGQTYTINSSYPFRFGLISLRINTLLLSTSVQSLFLTLKYESVILLSYLKQQILQCCPGILTST